MNRRPLHQRLWSAKAPDFISENAQLLQVIDTIRGPTQGRGICLFWSNRPLIPVISDTLGAKRRWFFDLYHLSCCNSSFPFVLSEPRFGATIPASFLVFIVPYIMSLW